MAWIKIERTLFTLFVAVVLAGAMQVAREWAIRASIIILVLGGLGLALALAQFISDIKNVGSGMPDKALTMEAPAAQSENRWGNFEIWGWILGFYAAIHVIGFLAAVPLFVFSYIKAYGGGSILSIILGVISWGFVYSLFDAVLHVPWPEPLIVSLIS
jgi:hypothetical protein